MPAGVLGEVSRDASARMASLAPRIDVQAAEDAVRSLLLALGQDPEAEHLRQTPRRVAAAYSELLTPGAFELTTFENDEGYDQPRVSGLYGGAVAGPGVVLYLIVWAVAWAGGRK
jgi:GTP cyclohydrolase I